MVLGGVIGLAGYTGDLDNIEKGYFITHQASPSTSNHWPVTSSTDYAILTSFINNYDERFGIQTCVYKNGESYIRRKWISWGAREELSENIPSFYKDYADLASLASAVTVSAYKGNYTVETGGTLDIQLTGDYRPLVITENQNYGYSVIVFWRYDANDIEVYGNYDASIMQITKALGTSIVVTNNSTSRAMRIKYKQI